LFIAGAFLLEVEKAGLGAGSGETEGDRGEAHHGFDDGFTANKLAGLLVFHPHDILPDVAVAGIAEDAVGDNDDQTAAGLEQLENR
jgi:hypothetical protein